MHPSSLTKDRLDFLVDGQAHEAIYIAVDKPCRLFQATIVKRVHTQEECYCR